MKKPRQQFPTADRLHRLPPYLFAEIDRKKQEAKGRGADLIDFSIGDPDLPTPEPIIKTLREAAGEPRHHQYPSYEGMMEFREEAAAWFDWRFGVELDPAREILTLIGSKEGIAHLPIAYLNPGDRSLVPSPGYPVYRGATTLAGGEVDEFPLTAERGFLPDLASLKPGNTSRILFLNYPNNPTSAGCDPDFFREAVEFCRDHSLILASDQAYSEIYFDAPPPSALQAPGGKDVCIEFHSLSKSFNMTGWRIGFAAGNPDLIAGLRAVKTNIDSGTFQAVQMAGITALRSRAELADGLRRTYRARRDALAGGLQKAGLRFEIPRATFYFWVRVPEGHDSASFTTLLLEQAGVVTTPGIGFGTHGEGYVRFALTQDIPRIEEAARRISRLLG